MIIWRPISEAPERRWYKAYADEPKLLLWHRDLGMMEDYWPMTPVAGLANLVQEGITHFSEANPPSEAEQHSGVLIETEAGSNLFVRWQPDRAELERELLAFTSDFAAG